jgi:hypothetical protein
MSMDRSRWFGKACTLLLAPLAVAGCDAPSPSAPRTQAPMLATRFHMTGSAASKEVDGTCVTCVLDFFIHLEAGPRGSPGVLEYQGVHGGHLVRTIVDATGAGLSLQPEVYGSVVVRAIAFETPRSRRGPWNRIRSRPRDVQILIPINATTTSRFYRELSDFRGTFDSGGTATGTWNCAPFDINSGGYVDTAHVAVGTWSLTPDP